ncbi:MarR family transcriptional regulator [Bdellovibrionota bacterium FG-2]
MHPAEIRKLVEANLAFHSLNKAAEKQFGLSLVQYHLLVMLRDLPGCSPQELAEAVGMHPSTLTQSLKRLKRKEAAFIAIDPRDSRKKILSLTRKGRALMARIEEAAEQAARS